LGDAPYPLILTIPSLRGQVCWVIPSQALDVLAALLLTQESHPLTFHDPDLTESFYRFLALEVLYQLSQLTFDKTLTPILTSQTTLPQQDSLCKDIAIVINEQTLWGRLILSPEFRLAWTEHFAHSAPTELSQQLSELASVIVHLEAGQCEMSLREWQAILPGDFILLDRCSLDADSFNGRVVLTVNGKKAFRAKLKDGTLKILELPLLHEVDTPMAKQPNHELL
jgi:flagellar motor switch protein FliN/FliY